MRSAWSFIAVSLAVAATAACFNPGDGADETSPATTSTAPASTTAPAEATSSGATTAPTTDPAPTTAGPDTTTTGPMTTSGVAPTAATTGPDETTGETTTTTTTTTGDDTTGAPDETTTIDPPGICGNAILEAGEACDPGGVVPGCGIDCQRNARFVFVTSATFDGSEVAGTAAADAHCDAVAPKPFNFRDTPWVAWLSTPNLPAAGTRVLSAPVPFLRLDGTIVAANKAQFVSDKHTAAINVTEQYTVLAPAGEVCPEPGNMVWTGTGTTGLQAMDHCTQWTSNDSLKVGRAGRAQVVTAGWTAAGCLPKCDTKARLYCVENLP